MNLDSLMQQRLGTSPAKISELCQKWHITELSLFGSVMREDDCNSDSDIDLLTTFSPTFQRELTETLEIREELAELFGRRVELLVKEAIERSQNWLRCQKILDSAQVIYVA